jgi:integrase
MTNVELADRSADRSLELENEVIRFTVTFPIKRKLHEEIKAYAKARRIPITTFTYQIILDYLRNNPKEID